MPRSSAAPFTSRIFRGAYGLLSPAAALLVAICWSAPVVAITVQFDYRYDSAGFFGSAEAPTPARAALEFAAKAFSPFTDGLAAIQPGGENLWSAGFTNPATGTQQTVANLSVPHGAVRVFAATRDLPGATLAEAGPGFLQGVSGPSLFRDAVVNRGQGPAADDFGPWGGFISFDIAQPSGEARQWHFDVNSAVDPAAYDFCTVAVHELAHILGFGTSTAYLNDVSGNQFVGQAAQQLYQNPVPLAGQPPQHFGFEVTSPPFLENRPPPALGRLISLGERKPFTPLDYAAMSDIGWEAPPVLLGLPGDVDLDYDVDGSDFLGWQRGLGGAGGAMGDVNGDLAVDSYDGWLVRHHLGSKGYNPSEPPPGALRVPEPGGAAMVLLAAAFVLARWAALTRYNIVIEAATTACSQRSPK
jgi:hypothetical protein